MREEVLRRFFEGEASATDLARDLEGALVPDEAGVITRHLIVDMAEEFEVRPQHLVRVCDVVLDDAVQPEFLEAIGFCLVASDTFRWNTDSPEGERVADVAFDWSAPEINHPLTRERCGVASSASW